MVLVKEYVSTFHVSVKYIEIMKTFKPPDDLYYDFPDVLFLHPMLLFVAITDSLKHISVIGKLHNDAAFSISYKFPLTIKC